MNASGDRTSPPLGDCAEFASAIATQRPHREQHTLDAADRLRHALSTRGIEADVSARVKSPRSTRDKMRRQQVDLEGLHDLCGVRVVVGEIPDCYAVLAIVHDLWSHLPEAFDDYIAHPKANGYQSLHTVIVLPCSHTLEVQVRTTRQHRHAEVGAAAHARYKRGWHDVE